MTDDTTEDTAPSMDVLAKVYIKMRDKLSELTRVYEEEETRIKAQQAEVANAMKDIIQKAGGTGIKTAHGTVSLKTTTRYFAQDKDAFKQFVIEHAAPDLYEQRVAQKNMAEFLTQNPGVVPPGLCTMSEITVSVVRPRK